MKKKNILAIVLHTLIVSVALCMFVSCSKNADIGSAEDMTIGFTASDSRANTKLTDSGFDGGDKMGVFGYLVHNGTNGTNATINYAAPYINNLEISYTSASTYASYSPAYYWPNMGYATMNFCSYYPYRTANASQSSGPQVITSANGKPYFIYKTDVASMAATEDFLVAQASCWQEVVKFGFKRPLAKVEWKVKNLDFIGFKGLDISFNIIQQARFDYFSGIEEDGKGWSGFAQQNTPFVLDNDVQVNGLTTEEYNKLWTNGELDASSVVAVLVDECYLIPQKISAFNVIYNYHTENVISAGTTPLLDLQPGYKYVVTLVISRDKVIRVETSSEAPDGSKKEWITITNVNDI